MNNYTIIFKSKYMDNPLIIECTDFGYTANKEHQLELLVYKPTVYLNKRDVTNVCRVTNDKMTIGDITSDNAKVVILSGEHEFAIT